MQLVLAIGSDHRGYELKKYIIGHQSLAGYQLKWVDMGTDSTQRTDYPIYAEKVAQMIQAKEVTLGVLLCGTGTGMVIAANRFPGVYAGLAWNTTIAALNKEDDNCNVLVLPADYITEQETLAMLISWLLAKFKEGRYANRIAMIDSFCIK